MFLIFNVEIPRSRGKSAERRLKERNRMIIVLAVAGRTVSCVIKRVFGAGRGISYNGSEGFGVMMVTAFAFNLYQLCTMKKANVI